MTIRDFLKNYSTNNTPIPTLDAEVLLAHALRRPREYLLQNPNLRLTIPQLLYSLYLLISRMRGEPIAYLTGHREFFGLDFKVNRHVLIPRPETELLVEEALQRVTSSHQNPITSIIDIGTGSGAIIVSLCTTLLSAPIKPLPRMVATDLSRAALRIARHNATHHTVSDYITFLRGNLLEPVQDLLTTQSLVIANLPYLTRDEIAEPSIRFEPRSALFGGADGLDIYRTFFMQLKNILIAKPQQTPATIVLEIGSEQGEVIASLVRGQLPGYTCVIKKDYCGLDRVVILTANQ